MVYNLDVTKDHPLADKFALDFNDMVKADGGRGVFPGETVAISLDNAERAKRKHAPESTMDSALGITSRGSLPRTRNKRMLMCEFRFKHKNWKNISKTELEEKVAYSKSLMQENYDGNIESKCFFIFDKSVYQQAKSYFSRAYSTRTGGRIVVTEEEFLELIF